jgi:hypothetical protein
MAVQTGFVTREQVDECMAELESGSDSQTLPDLLDAKGLLAPGQAKFLDQLADKEPTPVQDGTDKDDEDADFGRIVEIKRLAAAGEVEKVKSIVSEMKGDSRFARLGKILLKKSMLVAEEREE